MEEKTKCKLSKKQIIIFVASVLLVVSVASGVTISFLLKQGEGSNDNINIDDYKVDAKALLQDYQANPDKEFTAAELVNIGLEKYRTLENCYSIGIGNASTLVNQTIRAAQIKNGNQYFEENISKSTFVSLADRHYQEGIGNGEQCYRGTATDVDKCTYENPVINYNEQETIETWGRTLDQMSIYVISNLTVKSETSKIEKIENNDIKIILDLDPAISTYYYKIQMKNISNLDALPNFQSVLHTYVFDKDMNIKTFHADEKYKAKKILMASIHSEIDYYYFPNEFYKIPTLEERIDYQSFIDNLNNNPVFADKLLKSEQILAFYFIYLSSLGRG